MRKLKKLLICFLCLVLSGCVKVEMTTKISKDKKADIEVLYYYLIDKSLSDTYEDADESEESKEQLKMVQEYFQKAGYTIEEYKETTDENLKIGAKIKKTITNIDDVTKTSEKIYNLDALLYPLILGLEENKLPAIDDSQLFYKDNDVYKAKFLVKAYDKYVPEESDDDAEEQFDDEEDLFDDTEGSSSSGDINGEILKTIKISYKVVLLNKNVSNNATTVSDDGKTLTWEWNLDKKEDTTIEYSFEFDNLISYLPYVIAGVAGIALVVVLILVIKKSGSKNQNNAAYENQNVGPQYNSNNNMPSYDMNQYNSQNVNINRMNNQYNRADETSFTTNNVEASVFDNNEVKEDRKSFCPYCGQPASTKFCPYCGAKLKD